MNLSDIIQNIANTSNREFVQLIKCTVVSYNENDKTIICKPITSNFVSNITVKTAIAEGNNIEYTPSIDSIVLLGYTDNNLIEIVRRLIVMKISSPVRFKY